MPKKSKQKSNPSVINRFTGRGGKERLVDALCCQSLVAGNIEAAKLLANCSKLIELPSKNDFMVQGAADADIYFILSGSVSIIVNSREIATRKAGEHVGEMALIDTTARRSATVKTLESSVVAKVSETDFTQIANLYPAIWRKVAVVISQRLRERNKFHPTPRIEPVIFIGSSSEGLEAAKAIHKYLLRYSFVPRLWSEGVFECSKTTIEDLMLMTRETDFAVIIFSPDDITKSRGKHKVSPRDNVILELGLFMGALSRERTYIVAPKDVDIKIPTDLLGVKRLSYKCTQGRSLSRCLQPVKKELYSLIKKYGPM